MACAPDAWVKSPYATGTSVIPAALSVLRNPSRRSRAPGSVGGPAITVIARRFVSRRCSAAWRAPSKLSMSTKGRSMPSGGRPALRTAMPEAARVTARGCRSLAPASRTPSKDPVTSGGAAIVDVAGVAVMTTKGTP